MLPLSLLRAAKGSAILVELKSGETYNGHLVSTDAYMNVTVSDVICTAASGDKFYKLASANIRGSAIKYLRLPDNCLQLAQQEDEKQNDTTPRGGGGRRGGGYNYDGQRGSGGRNTNGGRNTSGGRYNSNNNNNNYSNDRGSGRGGSGRSSGRGYNNSRGGANSTVGGRGGGRYQSTSSSSGRGQPQR